VFSKGAKPFLLADFLPLFGESSAHADGPMTSSALCARTSEIPSSDSVTSSSISIPTAARTSFRCEFMGWRRGGFLFQVLSNFGLVLFGFSRSPLGFFPLSHVNPRRAPRFRICFTLLDDLLSDVGFFLLNFRQLPLARFRCARSAHWGFVWCTGRVAWARFWAGGFHVGFMFLPIVEELERSETRIHILFPGLLGGLPTERSGVDPLYRWVFS
jgi:hypothetical protein